MFGNNVLLSFFLLLVLLLLNIKHNSIAHVGNSDIYYKLVSVDVKLDEYNEIIKKLQNKNQL